jgi:transposase
MKVTNQRTAIDFAQSMKQIVDEQFPRAIKVKVILDNLNTHNPASLYKAFSPNEAKRILDRLEFHYTPKHGSWLNMVEIEFSVLSRQCLNRRIPNIETMKQEVAAWTGERNRQRATVEWRFTCQDARVKLKRLYPQFTCHN